MQPNLSQNPPEDEIDFDDDAGEVFAALRADRQRRRAAAGQGGAR